MRGSDFYEENSSNSRASVRRARFVTLEKDNPEFMRYMTGAFSEVDCATPIESYNISSKRERVTFRIEPRNQERSKNHFLVWFQACRPPFLSVGLGPLFVAWFDLHLQGLALSWAYALSACASLLFFHLSVFMLNDYSDHISGKDRRGLKRSGFMQIPNVRPYEIQRWGYLCLVGGGLLGLPALSVEPLALGLIGSIGILAVATESWLPERLRSFGFGEAIRFLCLGPLLCFGYGLVISGEFAWPLLFFGFFFGLAANLIFQLKQLESFYRKKTDCVDSWITSLGFDRGRKWIGVQILLFSFGLMGMWLFDFKELGGWGLIYLVPIGLSLWIFKNMSRAKSSLSSSLQGLWRWGTLLHFCLSVSFLGVLYWKS